MSIDDTDPNGGLPAATTDDTLDLPLYYGRPIDTPTGHRWAGYATQDPATFTVHPRNRPAPVADPTRFPVGSFALLDGELVKVIGIGALPNTRRVADADGASITMSVWQLHHTDEEF